MRTTSASSERRSSRLLSVLSTHCIKRRPMPKTATARSTSPLQTQTDSYSAVEFVMTLAWFVRMSSFHFFPLSQRGFVTFSFSDIFLNPHIDPRQGKRE